MQGGGAGSSSDLKMAPEPWNQSICWQLCSGPGWLWDFHLCAAIRNPSSVGAGASCPSAQLRLASPPSWGTSTGAAGWGDRAEGQQGSWVERFKGKKRGKMQTAAGSTPEPWNAMETSHWSGEKNTKSRLNALEPFSLTSICSSPCAGGSHSEFPFQRDAHRNTTALHQSRAVLSSHLRTRIYPHTESSLQVCVSQ